MIKRKINITGLFLFVLALGFRAEALGEEIKIVFTGQSYSMLYPCSCPMNPEGGVARRATVINGLRAVSKDAVVVEAGASFSSGQLDQHTQNFEMDTRRTEIYVSALKTIGYDALLLSGQEFSFGKGFIERYPDMPFVSSNMAGYGRQDVIKDLGWIKIGILGLTDNTAYAKGVVNWLPPENILAQRVAEIKQKGANLVVLLSSLNPGADQELLKVVKGIDVVINGSPSYGSVNLTEVEGVAYLTTWWQARKVGVLTLELSGNVVTKKSIESIPLGRDVADDDTVKGSLPQCFTAGDCSRMNGLISNCENPSLVKARCVYTNPGLTSMVVIRPRACYTCRIEEVVKGLKATLGELSVDYLFEDDVKAQGLIKEFGLAMLPAYLFRSDIEKSAAFSTLGTALIKGNEYYLLKPERSGVSYLLGRKRTPKSLDVIFGFTGSATPELFTLLKNFRDKHKDVVMRIHFLAIPDEKKAGKFLTLGGNLEAEELGRIA